MLRLFASLPITERSTLLDLISKETGVDRDELEAQLIRDWRIVGRSKQQPPPGDWTYWFLKCGRGFGKTLTAAQWTKDKMEKHPGCRVALVAPTLGDGRDTQVEGVSGMLAVTPPELLRGGRRQTGWNRSLLELYFANGSQAKVFGSDEGDRLRGPEHDFVWAEEVSSWKDAHLGNQMETTWSNAVLGARGGDHPQFVITSTPKPNKLTKYLVGLEATGTLVLVTGSSYENQDNLPQSWWDAIVAPLEGTRTGKQEIMAELLEDVEGALWRLAQIEALRIGVDAAPDMQRVVVAVDPNASAKEGANAAGIIVCGLGHRDKHGYVMADRTTTSGGPAAWANAAVEAYYDFKADHIVAEGNNGGEMVRMTIRTVDDTVPVKIVHASRGKRVRAEPIAVLYDGNETNEERTEPGKVHHVGVFPELEEEQTTWTPESESPDRMDALVWGMSELMLKKQGGGQILEPTGTIPGISGGQRGGMDEIDISGGRGGSGDYFA